MSRRAAARGAVLPAALLLSLLPVSPASAAAPGLAITAPEAADFGTFPVGSRTFTAALGEVRVTTSGFPLHDATWVATVSTTGFSTGGGSAPERIPAGAVAYRSGGITAVSGLGSICAGGSPLTAVDLSVARTAFSCAGLSVLASTSLRWNPEITVTVGAGNVVGTYTGTITHSVA